MPGPDPRKRLKPKKREAPESPVDPKKGEKMEDNQPQTQSLAKGGRIGLRGGGICKRGMNRDAVGKNS